MPKLRRFINKWINLETGGTLTAKETLGVVCNGWLSRPTLDEARRMHADPAVTEDQAEAFLTKMDEECACAHAGWEQSQ